ncbi:DUF4270 family protein [Hymenobacter siberiensis]|uniref:DUF4270 family protein n=1 Tax=Hymenobacter siberiensis TaxID=2848396 RepID=UPI001C1E4BD4|nr:DUF4270 family protein [Hymenobacter siberiensis]MBU6119872.1 DUF4270 domain-containing protein [Hymenobacter siberiensis]
MNWLTSRCAPLVAFAALALTGCDTGTALNVDLPDTSGISTQYLDLPVTSGTVRLAPVQSLKKDRFLIGRLNDNVAGLTEARAYFNLLNGAVADSLPSKFTTPVMDSVVVVLGFDKVNGSTTPVQYDVYQLANPLDDRQVYDAGTSTPLGALLGQNLTSRLDRTQVQTVTAAIAATTANPAVPAVTTIAPDPTVRLILQRTTAAAGQPAVSSAFFTNFFQQLQQTNFTQAQLNALLKGLAITPSASHNANILSFGQNGVPRLVVYFHSTGATNNVLKHFYPIYFGAVSAYLSTGASTASDPRYYTQIINTLPPALQALATRPGFVASGDLNNTSYAQEGTGLGTRIAFTGLAALAAKPGLTVNRAELRVPVKPFSNALFTNPTRLYALEVNTANEVLQRIVNYTTVDRVVQADGTPQVGAGFPAYSLLVDGTSSQPYYSIPVTSYLQAYLNNKLDSTPDALVLVPSLRSYGNLNSNTLTLDRAAIDAAKITLRVYYSQR